MDEAASRPVPWACTQVTLSEPPDPTGPGRSVVAVATKSCVPTAITRLSCLPPPFLVSISGPGGLFSRSCCSPPLAAAWPSAGLPSSALFDLGKRDRYALCPSAGMLSSLLPVTQGSWHHASGTLQPPEHALQLCSYSLCLSSHNKLNAFSSLS